MRIHIHDHEINQGRRILELNQHILCYLIGLHHNGVCQLQLMRGRDQWVRDGQDVHASSLIVECMMDLECPQDAWNHGESWSAYPVPKLIEDTIAVDPGHGHFLLVG
jgi:hypothetical protein